MTLVDDSTDTGDVGGEPVTRAGAPPETVGGENAFSCPRCGAATVDEFYGPCRSCRADLRASVRPPVPAPEPEPERPRVTVSGLTTSRRWWQHKRRPSLFVAPAGGAVTSSGQAVPGVPAMADRTAWLHAVAGHRAVYVVGEDAAELVRSMFAGGAGDGWHRVGLHEHDRTPAVTWRHGDDGAEVKVAPVDVWAPGATDPAAVAEAWRWVAGEVADAFGGEMLGTPSTTGRDLMARSFPRDVELPLLSDELAELVRSTSTQHRMELVAPAGAELPGLHELDMRLAFAAVLRELPAGVPEWMTGEPDTYRPHRAGRYRATWTVPAGWSHVGILPGLTADGWRWERRPGATGSGWVDGAELAMARRHGWAVTVHESLVWPERRPCDPLRTWHGHLVRIYGAAGQAAGLSDPARRHASAMVRAIIIHAIGALRGKGEQVTYVCEPEQAAELVPAGASWWTADDGTVMWTERRAPAWPEWVRPEWAAAVWARTRCRLLDSPAPRGTGRRTGAMHLPAGVELVAFRGDALYLTDDPGWHDDGAVGRFRVKHARGPFTMPATFPQLDHLRQRPEMTAQAARAAARAALGARRTDGEG